MAETLYINSNTASFVETTSVEWTDIDYINNDSLSNLRNYVEYDNLSSEENDQWHHTATDEKDNDINNQEKKKSYWQLDHEQALDSNNKENWTDFEDDVRNNFSPNSNDRDVGTAVNEAGITYPTAKEADNCIDKENEKMSHLIVNRNQ